jgi:hypothetical protein
LVNVFVGLSRFRASSVIFVNLIYILRDVEANWSSNANFTFTRLILYDPKPLLQSVATTPEEEEELGNVQRWVEMMADIDNEEVDHLVQLGIKKTKCTGRPTGVRS